jgi:hypothetical protein
VSTTELDLTATNSSLTLAIGHLTKLHADWKFECANDFATKRDVIHSRELFCVARDAYRYSGVITGEMLYALGLTLTD